MKRKFLEDLGLEKEAIDKILDENSLDIGKAKGEVDSITSELDKLKTDLADRDKQLETLKNSTGDLEAMKKKIEDLQADNKKKDETHASEMKQLKVDAAVSAALSSSKAKNEKAVRALLDLEKIELRDDGTIKGLDDQIKKLVESEDSKFLFDSETKSTSKFSGVKPGEKKDGTPGAMTKEQFNKMSYKERVELYNSDKQLYDQLVE